MRQPLFSSQSHLTSRQELPGANAVLASASQTKPWQPSPPSGIWGCLSHMIWQHWSWTSFEMRMSHQPIGQTINRWGLENWHRSYICVSSAVGEKPTPVVILPYPTCVATTMVAFGAHGMELMAWPPAPFSWVVTVGPCMWPHSMGPLPQWWAPVTHKEWLHHLLLGLYTLRIFRLKLAEWILFLADKAQVSHFRIHNTILEKWTQSYLGWFVMAIPTSPAMGMCYMAPITAT